MLQLKQYQNLEKNIKLPLVLLSTSGRLELRKIDEPKLGGVFVDFVSKSITHRRHFGGGCKEAIAKAVGIKGNYFPNVLDATAGLGRDSFILAAIGCHVLMLERHPVVVALLNDGLQRGFANSEIGSWLKERLKLLHTLSQQKLNKIKSTLDVVYLDPMYPFRQKSAMVKKEARLLQLLVGSDEDANTLLEPARCLAKKRVVVKRPKYAPPLGGIKTNSKIITKNHRFDIYLPLF